MSAAEGNGQKSPSSKAAAFLARGAYSQYVSTTKGGERCWRLFSTFPSKIPDLIVHHTLQTGCQNDTMTFVSPTNGISH